MADARRRVPADDMAFQADAIVVGGGLAGLVAGGGGMHGYRALEGTFLGGCLFSGRVAGRSLAAELWS